MIKLGEHTLMSTDGPNRAADPLVISFDMSGRITWAASGRDSGYGVFNDVQSASGTNVYIYGFALHDTAFLNADIPQNPLTKFSNFYLLSVDPTTHTARPVISISTEPSFESPADLYIEPDGSILLTTPVLITSAHLNGTEYVASPFRNQMVFIKLNKAEQIEWVHRADVYKPLDEPYAAGWTEVRGIDQAGNYLLQSTFSTGSLILSDGARAFGSTPLVLSADGKTLQQLPFPAESFVPIPGGDFITYSNRALARVSPQADIRWQKALSGSMLLLPAVFAHDNLSFIFAGGTIGMFSFNGQIFPVQNPRGEHTMFALAINFDGNPLWHFTPSTTSNSFNSIISTVCSSGKNLLFGGNESGELQFGEEAFYSPRESRYFVLGLGPAIPKLIIQRPPKQTISWPTNFPNLGLEYQVLGTLNWQPVTASPSTNEFGRLSFTIPQNQPNSIFRLSGNKPP